MARAKRHYIPGYVWDTPVKQKKIRFNPDEIRAKEISLGKWGK